MNYRIATAEMVNNFAEKPETLNKLSETLGSRLKATVEITALVASSVVLGDRDFARPGQIAQSLSDWHFDLKNECSEKFRYLTKDPDGPQLSREEANATGELEILHGIRRGIRRARNEHYKRARNLRNGLR